MILRHLSGNGIMWFSCIFISGAVKLSIKSFRIPELFIEVPETATVGSLKVHGNMYFLSFPHMFGSRVWTLRC